MSQRVVLRNVAKSFGSVVALKAINLEIKEGEFITLLGPSGCGKTTTLRLIAGFNEPDQGQIFLGDEDITNLPPQKREIGMVFQDYALFPHLTIKENIAFPLRERRTPKENIDSRVEELLELVRLAGVEQRYPSELSGGQAQRISVARAVAYPPRVLLMDEPLGALDLKLREVMQAELRRIQQELQITTVFVTHDQTEAMNMSDRIAVMRNGEIEQVGTAREIYNFPRSAFVADFVGRINLLDAKLSSKSEGIAELNILNYMKIRAKMTTEEELTSGPLCVGIRPEKLVIGVPGQENEFDNRIPGTVIRYSFSGNLVNVFVDIGADKPFLVEQRPDQTPLNSGTKTEVCWNAPDTLVLSAE